MEEGVQAMKPVVLFPSGYRSEKVLSDPIRKRFRHSGKMDIIEYALQPGDYFSGYTETVGKIAAYYPDFAVLCADRTEMAGAAAACFNHGIPFAHIYAGISNNIGTTDDVNRHVMTLQSTIQFCEGTRASNLVYNLRRTIGLPTEGCFIVGITHMDDAIVEPWDVPKKPFDIVAYNPPATHLRNARQREIIEEEWDTIMHYTKDTANVLALFPAPDRGDELIREMLDVMSSRGWKVIPSLPREQYFYALQQCERFISNSSAAYYEAPALMKNPMNIIKIGLRNSGRDEGPFQTGAADKIVKIVENYVCIPTSGKITGNDL
jgi:UDP-N-acetylglucosamine 2-epimerase